MKVTKREITAQQIIDSRPHLANVIASGGQLAQCVRHAALIMADYELASQLGRRGLADNASRRFDHYVAQLGFNPLDAH